MTKPRHNNGKTARLGIGIGLLAIALIGSLLVATAAGAVATDTLTIDYPENQSVDITLNFSDSADATVELESTDGSTTYDDETISGSADETETATLDPSTAPDGELTLNTTADDEDHVSIDETTLETTKEIEVDDADNETVDLDVGFSENGTADVEVLDDESELLVSDSLSYDDGSENESEGDVLSESYNSSDGIEDGNLTVTAETSPATAHDGLSVSVEPVNDATDGSGGIIDEDVVDEIGSVVPIDSLAGLADDVPGGWGGVAIIIALVGLVVAALRQ